MTNVSLSPRMQEFVEAKLKEGAYDSADQKVEAGLVSLKQQNLQGDFTPGELARLLAVGETDLANGHTVDGESFFDALEELSAKRRNESDR